MLPLLADENFNHIIIRGLGRKLPGLDICSAQEVFLEACPDPEILEWAAQRDRILVTHDARTMPGFAAARVRRHETMPGVFVVPSLLPIGQAIEELALLAEGSLDHEWRNQILFLPL